jgi:hypothetical protein
MSLGVKRADPTLTTVECPVADDGDGTLRRTDVCRRGCVDVGPVEANTAGLAGVYALSDLEPDRQRSISRAGELLALATERLTRELLCSGTADDR